MKLLNVAATIGLLVLAGCTTTHDTPLPLYHGDRLVRGSVERVEQVGRYSAPTMRVLLWFARASTPIPVLYGANLYRVTYWSQTNGSPVLVSGLMAVPKNRALRGTLLWMHGSNLGREASVSAPSLQEGVFLSAVFAGGGYIYLAPDLVGLGVSKETQAYFYNPTTIDVTLDFLKAAQNVTQDLNLGWSPNLYLTGFSEGGHDAAVIARELERLRQPQWQVKATAGIAGPYNLADLTLPQLMSGIAPGDSTYLTNFALSYATYYHQPLESVLTPASTDRALRLFDGNHVKQIIGHMPANPREIFTPEFLSAFDEHQPNWFIDALRANEAYRWAPVAPFRVYYGDKDIDVSPNEAKFAVEQAKQLGGNAEAVPLGDYDHLGSVLQAVPKVRQWFDELSETGAPHKKM
jgi:hypothetical protein